MAKRTEAPTTGQLMEELDGIGIEDAEGAEPAEATEGATPPEGTEAPAEGAEPEELTAEEQEAEQAEAQAAKTPPSPAVEAQKWQPPPGGQPFRFRADHREVEVPGALEWDHGIYVPKDAWNGVVSRHLADREQVYQTVTGLQRQVEELQPDRNPEVLQARVTLQKFLELFDSGPEAVAQWLDNFAVNAPRLQAEIQAQTYQQQLQLRQQQSTLQDQEYMAQQLTGQLPGYLEQNIEALIGQVPELGELKGSTKQLREQLWPFARALFWEADRDYPEHGVMRGQIVVRRDALEPLLKQEATRRLEAKRLQAGQEHNARALGKTPPLKTVPSRGRPVPAGTRKEYKPGESRQAKDDFLEWNPLAE